MVRILIIEDDHVIGQMLSLYFAGEGYIVRRVETAREGYDALSEFMPQVILLDLMLPDSDGTELCGNFRLLTNVPILIVSMKNEVIDRVNALTSGADDYVTKPFSMQELKARIEAVLRRVTPLAPPEPVKQAAASGSITVDNERRLLFVHGSQVETTYSEWELVKLFVSSPDRVFTRDELINTIRGTDSYINDRAIDVHIMNLRKKIEKNPRKPLHLKTVWGTGYKFVMD